MVLLCVHREMYAICIGSPLGGASNLRMEKYLRSKGNFSMRGQRFQKKRGHCQPQNISVFMKIGVIFSLKVSEKGSF